MNSFLKKVLIFVCLALLVVCEDTPNKQDINLNELYNIALQKGQTKVYTVEIKNLKSGDSLFIEAASPVYDPYQIPYVVLKSQNEFQQYCSEESNEYVGICQVDEKDLKQNKKFDILITCKETCNLKLQAFLSETFQVDFGHKIAINALKQMGTIEQFKIKVPENTSFTDISIVATLLNKNDVDEGVQMYVNIGNDTVAVPTSQDYQFKGNGVWGNGIGVFLSNKQIKAGEWIKVYLVIGQGVSIQFYSRAIDGDAYSILLNTAYEDFTSEDDTKLYTLNLTDFVNKTQSDNTSIINLQTTIQIIFVIYSGQPKIRVAFDKQFKNYLQNYDIQGTLSYLVSPEIRQKKGFKDMIYIEVTSFWSSNFYFSTRTVSNKFYTLADGISQLNRQNIGEIQNYIYQSYLVVQKKEGNKTNEIQSYKLKIQIIEGNAQVGVRRCRSLQKNDTLDCVIANQSQLQDPQIDKTFAEINITVRRDWSAYQLLFEYNASLCELYKQFGNLLVYNCNFQVIVFPNKNSKKQLVYAVTMYQNREQGSLKQGYSYKDFLYQDTYHYYDFQLPSIQNVEQITFYLTIISGDAAIIGTTNQKFKYMELTDGLSNEEISVSFFNTLTFKKDKLAKKFYLAVYAYDASDITVSVLVKRLDQSKTNATNNTTDNTTQPNKTLQVTTLYLIEALSQQYSLTQGNDKINFAFKIQKAGDATIELIQIEGDVDFHLQKQGFQKEINCDNKVQVGQLKCTFKVQANTKYLIHVVGSANDIETFSISYFYSGTCKKYPFNLPQFVFLAAKQTQCSAFAVTDVSKSLKVLTSFSTLDILSTHVVFTIKFNGLHEVQFTGREKQIPADELKQFCKSNTMDNCNMEIFYKGDQQWNVQYHFVVEQIGKQMALFDGIVRKVVDQKMSQKKGKFFYYEVSSLSQSIKIFTTNRDNVGYYIGSKFVQVLQFTASPDSLYLPYRNVEEGKVKQKQNVFQTRLYPRRGTSVIQIQTQEFSKYCKACVMLISVYGLQTQSNEANIFELQVTQEETFLYLGEQKTGFLSEDEIYLYEIYADPHQESLLSIRDFSKESSKQKDCFSASIVQIGTTNVIQVQNGYAIIPNNTATYKIFVQNQGQTLCSYQVSFSTLAKPVEQINNYMPIEIKLSNSQIKYFLYRHKQEDSFQVLNYIKTGDLKIFANKVVENNTIQNLINKNVQMYDLKSFSGDSFLYVTDVPKKFCKNCFYLIAVKGDPAAQSQMVIARGNQSIGLTSYGILKQTLKKNQVQNYAYYSIFDFNVTVPLLFGEVRVVVKNPEGKEIFNKTITVSTEIVVPRPNNTQGQYMDFYNQNSRFQIQIQAIKQSSYYISIKKKNVAMRIYEGVPIGLLLQNKEKTIEFVNNNAEENVSVLIEIKEKIAEDFNLDISAQVMKDGSTSLTKLENPTSRRSENSFNYVFKSFKGTYFITFKAKQNVTSSLLLAKKKLTHLMSSNVNLFVEKGTFQIYTPGHNIMIVVDSCLSEVQVRASDKYEAIVGNTQENAQSALILQHANYGGHYVITAQNVQGEYFVKVDPKDIKDRMLYIISYYYYDKSDVMPYKKVDIDSDISYKITSDKIIFSLNPVRLIPSKQKFKIFPTYTLYISNSVNTTTMDSKCDLNIGFSLSQTASGQNDQPISFAVDFPTIANQVGQKTVVYYVSAKVKVRFEGQNLISGYPPFVDLAYVKLQMTQATHTVEIKSETTSNLKYIMLWIVIPVLITLIMFILALKFCIKKYRMLYPDQLVEEDIQMGESQDKMKNSHGNNAPTDSLTNT